MRDAYREDGNVLELNFIGKSVYFTDNILVVDDTKDSEAKKTFEIPQINGIDSVDRIDFAWKEICKFI